MKLARALALSAALLLSTRGAHADPRTDTAHATTALGVTHAEAGRWEEALTAFEEAHRLDPQPTTLFNVAQARLQTHRARAAVEAYQALLAMRSALPARQIEGAERGLAQARASIGRITPHGNGELFVDDRRASGGPIEVDPGPHVVRLVKQGRDVGLRRVVVKEGQALDVLVEAEPESPPSPAAATTLPPPVQPESRPPVLAISLLAAGVVTAGVGTFFSIRGYGEWSELKDGCSKTATCGSGSIADARRDVLIGDVLIGVGIVAVAVGAYLFITAPSSPRPRDLAVRF